MTVHHADIYHCQKCGKICSREHEDCTPECCCEQMERAVANITYEDDSDQIGSPDEVIVKSNSAKRSQRHRC